MANYYPLQSLFNGGEMSPRLYGQADTERYHASLETMTNFIALPQGPAMRRQGFAYVVTALNTTDVRLLPFKIAGAPDYLLELGPGYLSILNRAGRQEFTSDELLTNGDFSEGLLKWDDSSDPGTEIYMTTTKDLKRVTMRNSISTPNSGMFGRVIQTVDTSSTSGVIDFEYTFRILERIRSEASGWFTNAHVRVGTTSGAGDLYDVTHGANEEGSGTNSLSGFGGRVLTTVDIGVNTTVFITLEIEVVNDGGFISFLVGSDMGHFADIKFSSESETFESFATPWLTEADLALVQYASESGKGRTFFVHPNFEPQVLQLIQGSWTFSPLNATMAPSVWTDDNWPAVVEIFQGRLWMAATPAEQNTIWGSKSGDYFDFTIGTGADDGMELPLTSQGGIQWLKGQKGLVVGTDLEEIVITGTNKIITPTDRDSSVQSGWGSVDIQPALAGNDIIYVSPDRTKVRAVNTFFNSVSWTSIDLTFVAEHITRQRVIETIYIQNPNYQIYFLLSNGTIVACTYDREHQVIGWMNLVTNGVILSLNKTDSVEGTILWVAVKRNDNIFIEAVFPDEEEWEFTDSWVKEPVGTDGLVTGLDHLEGMTVQILVDGAIEPDQVVSGGEITVLNTLGRFAVVGVEYEASMITLPLSGGNPLGTSLGSKRRFARIFVQLFDSALPVINGILPPDREPSTPMDTVQPNLTGVTEVRSLGREGGGRVTITQNLPKKTMVTAILGKASEEKT